MLFLAFRRRLCYSVLAAFYVKRRAAFMLFWIKLYVFFIRIIPNFRFYYLGIGFSLGTGRQFFLRLLQLRAIYFIFL